MQRQFLSNKEVEPVLPSQQSITLPNIAKRERSSGLQTIKSDRDVRNDTYSSRSAHKFITAKIQSPSDHKYTLRSLLNESQEKPKRAAKSTRPLMHVKNGKLMIAGK